MPTVIAADALNEEQKGCILVRVSIAAVKHHDQKQVGEGSVYVTYTSHHNSSKKARTATQAGQEPGGRS